MTDRDDVPRSDGAEPPGAGVVVRRVVAGDLDVLAALNDVVQSLHWRENPEDFLPPSKHAAAALLSDRLASGEYLGWLALVDGVAAGYVLARISERPATPLTSAARVAWVDQISVAPASTRHGVGRSLMAEVEAFATSAGVDRLGLNVWQFNADARAFFGACGFEVTNVTMAKRAGTGTSPTTETAPVRSRRG